MNPRPNPNKSDDMISAPLARHVCQMKVERGAEFRRKGNSTTYKCSLGWVTLPETTSYVTASPLLHESQDDQLERAFLEGHCCLQCPNTSSRRRGNEHGSDASHADRALVYEVK